MAQAPVLPLVSIARSSQPPPRMSSSDLFSFILIPLPIHPASPTGGGARGGEARGGGAPAAGLGSRLPPPRAA
eukprot:5030111-Pyramimonas_sp.AAC.2